MQLVNNIVFKRHCSAPNCFHQILTKSPRTIIDPHFNLILKPQSNAKTVTYPIWSPDREAIADYNRMGSGYEIAMYPQLVK